MTQVSKTEWNRSPSAQDRFNLLFHPSMFSKTEWKLYGFEPQCWKRESIYLCFQYRMKPNTDIPAVFLFLQQDVLRSESLFPIQNERNFVNCRMESWFPIQNEILVCITHTSRVKKTQRQVPLSRDKTRRKWLGYPFFEALSFCIPKQNLFLFAIPRRKKTQYVYHTFPVTSYSYKSCCSMLSYRREQLKTKNNTSYDETKATKGPKAANILHLSLRAFFFLSHIEVFLSFVLFVCTTFPYIPIVCTNTKIVILYIYIYLHYAKQSLLHFFGKRENVTKTIEHRQ